MVRALIFTCVIFFGHIAVPGLQQYLSIYNCVQWFPPNVHIALHSVLTSENCNVMDLAVQKSQNGHRGPTVQAHTTSLQFSDGNTHQRILVILE